MEEAARRYDKIEEEVIKETKGNERVEQAVARIEEAAKMI
jgi:hypothetical protein